MTKTRSQGRPRASLGGCRRLCVSLPDELVEPFRKLGGSTWLQKQIRNAYCESFRQETSVCEAIDASTEAGKMSPLFVCRSMAANLEQINVAISQEGGDATYFKTPEEVINALHQGLLSLHSNGFIVWADIF